MIREIVSLRRHSVHEIAITDAAFHEVLTIVRNTRVPQGTKHVLGSSLATQTLLLQKGMLLVENSASKHTWAVSLPVFIPHTALSLAVIGGAWGYSVCGWLMLILQRAKGRATIESQLRWL